MKMERTPIYMKISNVKDPTVRAFLYFTVEEEWENFFQQKVPGLSQSTTRWKGEKITDKLLYLLENLPWKPYCRAPKIEWDALYLCCYMYPAWIGRSLSKEEREGWFYLTTYKIYRHPEYKYRKGDFHREVLNSMKDFMVSDDIREATENIFFGRDWTLTRTIWEIIYHYVVRGV